MERLLSPNNPMPEFDRGQAHILRKLLDDSRLTPILRAQLGIDTEQVGMQPLYQALDSDGLGQEF